MADDDQKYLPTNIEKIFELLDTKLVSFGLPTAIVAVGVNNAREGKWKEAGFCVAGAIGIFLVIKVGKKLAPKFDQLLDWSINKTERLILDSISAVSDREGKYLEALEIACLKMEIEGEDLGGLGLEEIYVALQVMSRRSQQLGLQRPEEIWQFLPSVESKGKLTDRRIVVLAPPGYGKTTLMRHIALNYANGNWKKQGVKEYLPVLMRFREIHPLIRDEQPLIRDEQPLIRDEQPLKLSQLVTQALNQQPEFRNLELKSDWFEQKLTAGKCLVILDGLDEVPKSQRPKVRRWADQEMRSYQKTPFVLTSRPHGFEQKEDEIPVPVEVDLELKVLELTPDQKEDFVKKWYRSIIQKEWDLMLKRRSSRRQLSEEQIKIQIEEDIRSKSGDLTRQIFTNPALNELAANPLLLTMIVKTHQNEVELPRNRVEIYEKIFSLLLGKRAKVKQNPLTLTSSENKTILQTLAWNLAQRETTMFAPTEGADWIQSCLARCRKDKQLSATDFLKEIQEITGLLQEKEFGKLEFSHPTFQEYLAARYLRESADGEAELLKKLDDDRWEEVIYFYAALSDASKIIDALIEAPSSGKHFVLARRCRDEGLSVQPKTLANFERLYSSVTNIRNYQAWQTEEDSAALLETRFMEHWSLELSATQRVTSTPITWAEFHIFLRDQIAGLFHSRSEPQLLSSDTQSSEPALLSSIDQQWFCAWLVTQKTLQSDKAVYHYRPATAAEVQRSRNSNAKNTIAPEVPPCPQFWDNRNEAPRIGGLGTSPEAELQPSLLYVVREEIPGLYRDLQSYLANGRWEEADCETDKVMLEVAEKTEQVYLEPSDLANFPCVDLQIIDSLWVQFSGGHFGFSVQKQIWQECGSITSHDLDAWQEFGDRIGWRKDSNWLWNYSDLKTNPHNSPFGELPVRCSRRLGGEIDGMMFPFLAQRLIVCSTQKS